MGFLVARTRGAPKAAILSDMVPEPLKKGQLRLLRRSLRLGVDMDHVSGLRPLVSPCGHRSLQLFASAKADCLECAADGGDWARQQPGDMPEGAAHWRAAVSVDRVSAAESGADCVDRPKPWRHRSGNGVSICKPVAR
jgi:hypothetical protein